MARIWTNGAGLALNAPDLNSMEADIEASTRANPTLTVVYNTDGSVASVTEDGIQTTYTYNTDGTVATATRLGITRTFTYDGNGNVTGAS